MTKDRKWRIAVDRLAAGLSISEMSRRLGVSYQIARRIAIAYKYPVADARKFGQSARRKIVPEEIDWTMSNIAIARKFNISRQRVKVVRDKLGIPMIEARGRKKVKKSVDRSCRCCCNRRRDRQH